MTFPSGKLPNDVLDGLLLKHTGSADPRLIVGPGVGEDAAVIAFGETCLVAKTDPVTFATDQLGWYAVHVNANDIAAMGATPKWFLSTIIVPQQMATTALFEQILGQIQMACASLNVAIAGGHTEITTGIDRPFVIGQMLGEVKTDRVIRSSGLKPGDVLLLTKSIAIEATSIIAREMTQTLRARGWTENEMVEAADYLTRPGISVVDDARIALAAGDIHAMHDPTEGGICTSLQEIATASAVDLDIDGSELPVSPLTQRICNDVGIEPLGAISSGALLIGCPVEATADIVGALENSQIAATQIGIVKEKVGQAPTVRLSKNGQWQPLPHFDVDEIARLLSDPR